MSGELYDVDDKMLASLDDLENHPHLYRRTTVECVIQQTAAAPTTSTNDSSDAVSSAVNCEVYMIHDYNPALLSLPLRSSYDLDAIKDKPYVFREDRDVTYDLFKDIKVQ